MADGTINIKLRPVKLGFLVDPTDKAALFEAIEINTFLWGGMYNPIIPAFNRIPKMEQDKRFRGLDTKKIIAGYLDAYDPDYVVPLGKCSKRTFEVGNRRIISQSKILSSVEEDSIPRYGIGLFEILDYFIDEELKFVRREPFDICFPSFGKRYRLFMVSIFGAIPGNINRAFKGKFEKSLGVKRFSCSISNYCEFLTPSKFFLRRMSSLYINPSRTGGWWRGQCIFFFDATNPLDIIDYWNLRAVGWSVLPVAKQSFKYDSTKRLAVDFIEKNFVPYLFNPQIYHYTTLLEGRSMTKQEVKEFVNSLKVSPSGKSSQPKYVFQDWYPRIWDEWARDKDGVECCELEATTTQNVLSDHRETITFRTLDPEFISFYDVHEEPCFANQIELRLYGGREIFAEVIPESNVKLIDIETFGIGSREWRFAKKGIVGLFSRTNSSIELTLPKAEDVFSEWLKLQNWKVELSPSGHIAKQMIMQLGGKWGSTLLANEGIIQLLGRMGEGKTIRAKTFRDEISKIANQKKFMRDPSRIIKRLLRVQMFRLGIELQCPICKQRSWYSIKDADYELQCSKCLGCFQIPSYSPEEIEWSYRTFGPFSLPNQAYGVYSVLLTLRFFSQLLHGPTTPIMSFNAEKEGVKIEADLGLLFQESKFGYAKTELIFAECKTYNSFDKRDAKRMKLLAKQFPGAVLVFATLRKSLTKKEKDILRPVVNRGRRYWRTGRPFNPVLILTGIELFSEWDPPECWKDVGGKHAAFAKSYLSVRDLVQLCDVTQQLYLDMGPWHQWLEKRWEERRKKRLSRRNGS